MATAELKVPAIRVDDDTRFALLAREHGTPLYVYDLGRLRARVAELRAALAPARAFLYFATMANDRAPVLRQLAELGVGACVNSLPHLALALDSGVAPESIQFTSTGIAREDLGTLLRLGVRVNLDSLSQLSTWLEVGGREAGIRINASSLGRQQGRDRIGIDAATLAEAVTLAARAGGRITGIHVYVGTNFPRPEEMLPTLEAFFALAATVETIRYVNIGGGVGIDYRHTGDVFDLRRFGVGVARYADRLRSKVGEHVSVVFEPGRALAAACGTFITAVTDVKVLGNQRFAAVDGSVAVFPRPFHHPDTPHRVRELLPDGFAESCADTATLVVGRTTFSRDILGSASLSNDLRPGSLLAFDDAGAYSQSMASRFLGQPEPKVVFLDEVFEALEQPGRVPAAPNEFAV